MLHGSTDKNIKYFIPNLSKRHGEAVPKGYYEIIYTPRDHKYESYSNLKLKQYQVKYTPIPKSVFDNLKKNSAPNLLMKRNYKIFNF